jgi:hypothetical protein
MAVMSSGATRMGTKASRANRARKIPRRSILMSVGNVGESIISPALTKAAPRDTRINGIATAPAVSIAMKTELCRKLEVSKNNSCCKGETRAMVTDAITAHSGGFIAPTIFQTTVDTEYVRRREGTSPERILNAGNDVKDSLDRDRRERLSILSNVGSIVDVDPVECSVEL